ncbi:tripartite tricarboxylate transporter TctB family protein [Cetobacterium sp. 2A]|uniref:tripartite tricarboxylate transporter TctB family protein n=1 Tax=unclassified Cetobacterium TaxID=2630983 RepID=UPI00163CACC8|nr:tripartite tricarboxylate transporter TctB family protein [Cetobacterium sp. 2A]MBC2857132.1 tripartite tricarboxylate transporter TctB family protein [Cetobacterium sp. 2A]
MIDRIFSFVLCCIGISVYYTATQFQEGFMIDNGLGVDFFPKVISLILVILSILMFIGTFKANHKSAKFSKESKYTFITIGLVIMYIFLIDTIGYLLSTILFSFAVISVLKTKSTRNKIIFSLLFPSVIYLLFTNVFKISLPTGILL